MESEYSLVACRALIKMLTKEAKEAKPCDTLENRGGCVKGFPKAPTDKNLNDK
jgi:hypothetical protein